MAISRRRLRSSEGEPSVGSTDVSVPFRDSYPAPLTPAGVDDLAGPALSELREESFVSDPRFSFRLDPSTGEIYPPDARRTIRVESRQERLARLRYGSALRIQRERAARAPIVSSRPSYGSRYGRDRMHRWTRECVDRVIRRQIMFAIGVGGRRRSAPGRGGSYRRGLNSWRSC